VLSSGHGSPMMSDVMDDSVDPSNYGLGSAGQCRTDPSGGDGANPRRRRSYCAQGRGSCDWYCQKGVGYTRLGVTWTAGGDQFEPRVSFNLVNLPQ
jgi:hypothetical protein